MPDGSLNVAPEMEMDSTGSEAKTKDPRELSTIGFPYHPLGNAIEVARAILNKGGVPLARDQLAVTMSRQLNSGYFTNDVATARIFGLIETIAGKYQLTQLGREILDPDENQARRARVKAFLNVPLYHKVYEQFRNTTLPPRPEGLESAFVSFGVAQKQKEKARRAFDRSARVAGFYEHGTMRRLIEPVLIPTSDGPQSASADVDVTEAELPPPRPPRDHVVTMPEAAEHPFIKGLLLSLPKLGESWGADGRVKWLKTAADAFELMYQGGEPITISPASGITHARRIKPTATE